MISINFIIILDIFIVELIFKINNYLELEE